MLDTEDKPSEVIMAWKFSLLVVANVTASSDELLEALQVRAKRGPTSFNLLIPATTQRGGREAAAERLEEALERMRTAGLEVEGSVGDPDPVVAVGEIWDPREWDEIVVSTLAGQSSRWTESDVPRRIEKLTDVPVAHVTARQKREQQVSAPEPAPDRWGVLAPLRNLAGGGSRD
jgi:hypothetical protein